MECVAVAILKNGLPDFFWEIYCELGRRLKENGVLHFDLMQIALIHNVYCV